MSQHREGIITEQMKDLGVSPLPVGNEGKGGWRKWEKKRRGQKFYCLYSQNK
jgi:hypothetical protein